jgi:hypothetical protein
VASSPRSISLRGATRGPPSPVGWASISRNVGKTDRPQGDSNPVTALKGPLSAAFEEGWTKIEGKTALTLEGVRAASRVGLRPTRLVGLREQGSAALAAATEQRRRAFMLVSRTYQEIRAAVSYVRRREGDAESIAPTLYSGKAKRRPIERDETQVPVGSVPMKAADPFMS